MNLLVKVYSPNSDFPTGGRVSQYLDSLKIGECADIKYPYGKIRYLSDGKFIKK
jgi:cytochrome-b5 reductase